MNAYLDASVLVSMFVRDHNTDRAHLAVSTRLATATVSDWGLAETTSAVSRAVRMGALPRNSAHRALSGLDAWIARAAERIEVMPGDIREVERLLRSLDTPLKTPDALHIVLGRRTGLALLTFDAAMARAATGFGLAVVDA